MTDDTNDDGWVDLTVDIHPAIRQMPFLPCPEMNRLSEQSETSLQVTELSMSTHVGTHIDAPSHAISDGRSIEQFDVNRLISTGYVHGVDAQPNGPIDVAALEPIEAALDRPEVDTLLIRTGWGGLIDSDRYLEHPYLTNELANWLVSRDLDLIGMDFLTPDRPSDLRADPFTYPVHTTLLGNDVLIAENLSNLAELVGHTVDVIAFPIRLRALDAAPARIAARIQRQ